MNKMSLLLTVFLFGTMSNASDSLLKNHLDDYSAECKLKVLKSTGWKIQTGPEIQKAALWRSSSCGDNKSTLDIPPGMNIANLNKLENDGLLSVGTLCAFQGIFNNAVRKATRDLDSNHLYWFTTLPGSLIDPGNTRFELLKNWERVKCVDSENKFGCYAPVQGHIYDALVELRHKLFETGCWTGLELAEYEAVGSIFGREKTDTIFTPDRFYVGDDITQSQSLIFGAQSYVMLDDGGGLARARLGTEAMVGMPGILTSVYPDRVNDFNNESQNFLVYKMSSDALTAFVNRGGVAGYDSILEQIWQLSHKYKNSLQSLEVLARYGLTIPNRKLPTSMTGAGVWAAQMQPPDPTYLDFVAKLNDPFLRETVLYVHPLGFKTLAYHILRSARLNPKTPFKVLLKKDTIHGEIFEQWLKMKLKECQ
jgi:hypothetical protein